MKIIINNIPESVKIIQSKINRRCLSVFCGAGISVKSGIPTVIPLVEKILAQLGCSNEDIKSFLKNKDLPIPFEAIIQEFKETFNFQGARPFLPEFIALFIANSNSNHYLLANLFEANKIDKIITTNFDRCIEKLFIDPKSKQRKLIVYSESEGNLKLLNVKGKIIKIHGSVERPSSIGATVDQITKTEFYNKNQIILNKVLTTSSSILFLGYSCSDKWDVTKVFSEFSKINGKRPEVIFWQHYDVANEQPTENQKKIFKNYKCTWMSGDTDLLISELARLNKVSVPVTPYIPAHYSFEKLKPINGNYVLGRLFQAANFYKLSVKYLEPFIESRPKDLAENLLYATASESLADVYRKFNQYRKSQSCFLLSIHLVTLSKTLKEKDKSFILARLYTKLGMLLLDNKKPSAANGYMIIALNLVEPFRKKRLKIDHKFQMAETYNDFAYLKHTEMEYEESEKLWIFSSKLREDLSKIYPQRYLRSYGESMSNMGANYYFMDQYDKAIDYCTHSIQILRELAEVNPTIYLPELAQKLNNLGAMFREVGNKTMALITLKKALSIREKLAEEVPDIYLPKVAYTLINLSVVYQKKPKNKAISLKYLDMAIPIIKRFKRKTAIGKYMENVRKILEAWSIDSEEYLKSK